MTDRLFLITGATDGIGKATALALAQIGATVILHGRDAEKTARAVAEIQSATGNTKLHTVIAEFAALDQVAALAEQVTSSFGQLSVLINNAGQINDQRRLSQDGFELTFAVNHLAPFLLTQQLLPVLKANAPARIVNVSSSALGGGVIDLDDLQSESHFDGWQAYANTKLANLLFSNLLAEQLAGSGVVSNALCPGLIDTNLLHNRKIFPDASLKYLQPRMRPPEEGAQVPLFLATADAAADLSGQFFMRDGPDGGRPIPLNWDRDTAAALWARSGELLAHWL
ncbi:MAG: SDR family NAD(P)-dependent oxidoreductase [Gammaproteobacteria bacterium]|nr:SDR family NAD(P)-dependent oxidoreductase [Gammaproteobacteria bacterium]